MKNRMLVLLAVCAALLAGTVCSASAMSARKQESLQAQYRSASEKYGVPEALLKAIGYTNTRWEMPPPQASNYDKGDLEGRGAYGIMGLYHNPSKDTLGRASRLTGIPEEKLKSDRGANIEGAASVLARMQGKKPGSINGWYAAVAGYGDGSLYANQVYETLKNGASARISTGETVELQAHPGARTQSSYSLQASGDYPGSTWYGASPNNYTVANRGAKQINYIVIHVTEGSWSSALSWFQNPNAQVSAHYVVRSSDGAIGQSVHEKDIAWHAGNWTYNQHSIGIEHEGYTSQSKWFTDAMYRSSAKLAAYLCKKYTIPIDRQHIIGHYQVPGSTHTDPGPYWNWDKYMSYVRQYAGSTPTGSKSGSYKRIVDNKSHTRFWASSNWAYKTWNSQHYSWNYRVTSPKAIADSANYRFDIPKEGNYAVYAWWPANKHYNKSTPIGVGTSSGWKWQHVNQTRHGGRWNYLGTYHMLGGDKRKVKVSRWTGSRGYVIADAVKIVKK